MKERELTLVELDELDVSFHLALVRASGNEASHLVMLALRHAIQMYILQMLERMPSRRKVIRRLAAEHDAIFRAVRSGDGEAASALLEAHVSGFYEDARRAERSVPLQRSRRS
jgi:GntR family transcriptional repressor for pyruvate dehydrogenase complex